MAASSYNSCDDDEIGLQGFDKRTKLAIEEVFYKTIAEEYVGVGADAKEIQYSKLKVLNIQRVVNPYLQENYNQKKSNMRALREWRGLTCKDIGSLNGSRGDVFTKHILRGKLPMDDDVNEHFLFHGTLKKNMRNIVTSGLDPKFSDKGSMFGPGVYCAEESSKADQYADEKGNRQPNGTKLIMFLARALMGHVFLCNDASEFSEGKKNQKFKGPPCMCCIKDKCPKGRDLYFDSVLGDGQWIHREFVVYEKAQSFPEFLITYTRV